MPDSKKSADSLARLEGSRLARRRLAWLLDLQSGACTARDACRALRLARSQLYDLRARALQAALAALEPRAAGRPRKPASAPATAREVRVLRAQVQHLQRELACARARGLLVELVSARERGDQG